jgi:hypothetical protein
MAAVLHIVGQHDPAHALAIMRGQVAAGDTVTVAVVGPELLALPPGVTAHRVPAELSYDQLLDLVFSVDQVISW